MRKPEDLLETVKTIVLSPLVEKYNIGITVDSKRRRSQYKSWTPTWPHYAVLEMGLGGQDALNLEKALQELKSQDMRSVLYTKYRGDTRDKPHTASQGGLAADNSRLYDLYICWGNCGDN